jgi:hypothetical protein
MERVAMWHRLFVECTLVAAAIGLSAHEHAESLVLRLSNAIEQYKAHHGSYPDDSQTTWVSKLISERITRDDGAFSFLTGEVRSEKNPNVSTEPIDVVPIDVVAIDRWGNPIRLRVVAGVALLYSVGENGIDDGGLDDDISNLYGFNWLYYNRAAASKWAAVCVSVVICGLILWVMLRRMGLNFKESSVLWCVGVLFVVLVVLCLNAVIL